MKVKFWGTRGSIATPGEHTIKYGGNTTCITIIPENDDFSPLIVDAGTGIRNLGKELQNRNHGLKLNILFTHCHWDHIQGFPFFAPANREGNTLTLYGCSWMGGVTKGSILTQMDSRNFPISYDALKAKVVFEEVCKNTTLQGMRLSVMRINHPGAGLGLRFTNDSGSIAFITDHELEDDPYIGANREETIDFCRNADILIHDAQYLKKEMIKGWGHSAIEDVFELAIESEVNKLALFHHDPNRTDKELDDITDNLRKEIDKRKLKLELYGAQEGMELTTTD